MSEGSIIEGMARPTVIRNEAILEAARDVFLERGILATSAEVAQRAGVSEGSIFKRFKTKAELFRAAMGVDLEDVLPALKSLAEQAGTRTVEQNLAEAGIETVLFFERVMPIIMMSWSNPKLPGCPPGYSSTSEPPPLRAHRHVAQYLSAELRLGRIHTGQPDVIARAFLGSLSHYVFSEMLAQSCGGSPIGLERRSDQRPSMEREHFVRGFVRVLVSGMERTSETTASAPPRPGRAARAGQTAPPPALAAAR
jgi:AcrR family transcriptional regulator